MKKIILIFSFILNSIIVSAQDYMVDTVFVVAAKYSLSAQYDKSKPYYDTKKIKDFWLMPYHKEYMGDSLIFDSNWDGSWLLSIEKPSMSLEFKNINDTAKTVNLTIGNRNAGKCCFNQYKNKSGIVIPYTALQRDSFDILLGNNAWSNEVIVAVVCQDYWSEKEHCYKKCDLTNYKKYSPHYYEVCMVFFKDGSAFSNYSNSRYTAIQKEYHKTHPNILARIGEMQAAGASRKEQKKEFKSYVKEAKNNKSN
ncbi:MAG: hypothetical protein J6Z01_15725 [Bacteroidales bacterium]|nr:hypothetical protein [Bacteroidales bacterium]